MGVAYVFTHDESHGVDSGARLAGVLVLGMGASICGAAGGVEGGALYTGSWESSAML